MGQAYGPGLWASLWVKMRVRVRVRVKVACRHHRVARRNYRQCPPLLLFWNRSLSSSPSSYYTEVEGMQLPFPLVWTFRIAAWSQGEGIDLGDPPRAFHSWGGSTQGNFWACLAAPRSVSGCSSEVWGVMLLST
jgi:hypothetical protein